VRNWFLPQINFRSLRGELVDSGVKQREES